MDDGLTPEQGAAVRAARRSLVRSLEESCGPEEIMALACAAVVGMFCDIVTTSAGARDLAAVVNRQSEQSGYRLVAVTRNQRAA